MKFPVGKQESRIRGLGGSHWAREKCRAAELQTLPVLLTAQYLGKQLTLPHKGEAPRESRSPGLEGPGRQVPSPGSFVNLLLPIIFHYIAIWNSVYFLYVRFLSLK